MKRALVLLASLALCLTGLLAAPPTASAGLATAGGSLSTNQTVLWDGCRDYRFTVTVDIPDTATYWDLEVVATSPGGAETSTYFSYEPSTTASDTFFFCTGTDHPGRFLVEATGTYEDQAGNQGQIYFTDSFVLRAPRSRVALRPSTTNPRPGQTVLLNVTVKRERPAGYNACGYCKVFIQVKSGTRWVKVRGLRGTTNGRGKVTIRARYNSGRPRIRAFTPRDGVYAAAVSNVVTLR